MKILHTVEFYYPSVGGMQEVVRQISEQLVAYGHDVTVATSKIKTRKQKKINGVKIADFNLAGNLAMGIKGNADEYINFIINGNFDIVTNFAAQQWATDICLMNINKIKSKKIFVPTGFSNLYNPAYEEYFNKLKIWMKKYDMNVLSSRSYRDAVFAKQNQIKKVILIPNGASNKEFTETNKTDAENFKKKLGINKQDFLILNVGSHTGFKGHREAIEIFKKAQIKNSTLLIVGNIYAVRCYLSCQIKSLLSRLSLRMKKLNQKILIKQLNRQDTVSAFKAADLFLFPSNIECSPIVLFECMASRTPFLSSCAGNAEEIVEWSKAGIILPSGKKLLDSDLQEVDISQSAKILSQIYKQKHRRKLMATNGYKFWRQHATWEKISKDYEKLYKSILSR